MKNLLLFILPCLFLFHTNKTLAQGQPTGNSCANAIPFCTSALSTYPNTTGVGSIGGGNEFGCLLTTPNPTWYFFELGTGGDLEIAVSQTSNTSVPLDVDFVLWGPFANLSAACSNYSAANIVDCSFSGANITEEINITNGNAGEYYLLLVTNFSGLAGTYEFQQTGGTASVSCAPLCNITSVTLTPTACDPNTGTYDLSGVINVSNPPSTGFLTITPSCGGMSPITVPAPFGSTYAFTLTGLNPTTGACSVTVAFSADAACTVTETYTSPAPCITCTTSASNSGPVCTGANFNLSVGAVPGATYSWTGPGGFTSASQNPVNVAAPSAAGTYTYTVTVNDGAATCTATTVVSVVNPPSAAFSYTTSSYCQLAGTNPVPAANAGATLGSFSSFPAGLTLNSTSGSINLAASAPGMYSVVNTIAATSTCVAVSDTVQVEIKAAPATPVVTNNGPVCPGATLLLSVANPIAGGVYSWSGFGGPYTGASVSIPSVTQNHSGTYGVTVTADGCTSAQGSTEAVVLAPIVAPQVSSNSPVCVGQNLLLSANSTAPNATYSWVYPDGGGSNLQNPVRASATVAMAGTYSVWVTSNGCVSATGTVNVSVSALPAPPSIFTSSPICEGEVLTLSTVLAPGATYTWTKPNGGTLIGQLITITNAQPSDSGTYSLVTPGASACGNPVATVNVVVNSKPPVPVVHTNSPLCSGQTLTLSTNPVAGATYQWTGPNGTTYSGQTVTIPNVTSANTGLYSVNVSNNTGCVSVPGTGSVFVNPAIAPASVSSNSEICEGETLELYASGTWPSGTTFTWTGPGGYSTSLQNPVRANATPAYSGNYTFRASNNGCSSDTSIVTVVVNPNLPAPQASVNSPICEGESIQFTTAAVGGATYNWVNPQGISFSVDQNPTIAAATAAHSGVYTLYINDGNGCTSLPGLVTVLVNPYPVANAAGNTPLCEGETLSLSTTAVPNATYSWAGPGFSSQIRNPEITSVDVTNSGTYQVWVTLNGCASEDSVHVQVSPQPDAPVLFSNPNPVVCVGQPLTLSAAGPFEGTYSWTGPVSFTGQDTTFASATMAMQGEYHVTVTIGGCTSPVAIIEIDVATTPQITVTIVAPADNIICQGETVDLKATGANNYSWTGGPVNNPNLSQVTASPTVTTTYTVAGWNNANACYDSAFVTITVLDPLVANAGPDIFGACLEDNVQLAAVTANGPGQWSIASGAGGVITNPTSPTSAFSGELGEIYNLVWTVTSPVCGSLSDTVVVTLIGNVTPPTAADVEECEPENGTNTILLTATNGADTYTWYADSLRSSAPVATGMSFVLTNQTESTTYYVTTTLAGCESEPVAVNVIINERPTIYAGPDVFVEIGQSVFLEASGGNSYSWSPSAGLNFPDTRNPMASPEETTTYTVYGTSEEGCTAADEVTVTVVPLLMIPNGFTPNGDGVNDVWEIDALTQGNPFSRVDIFNRWGVLIFSSVGYRTPWDGKYNGKDLPTATYYYVIERKPGDTPIAGSVTIIR